MLVGKIALEMRAINPDDSESTRPFSAAIEHDGTVYVSGQGPLEPDSETIVGDDVRAQTEQTLKNIRAILTAAGTDLDHTVRAGIYLRDMRHYQAVNEVYRRFMTRPFPARTAIEVDDLPIDIMVEIDVIAAMP